MLGAYSNRIERLRQRGAPAGEINGERERLALLKVGVEVRTWEAWTNHYRPRVLQPPVVYDLREDRPPDFSEPLQAVRSHFRARLVGDARTLWQFADGSGREFMQKYMQLSVDHPLPSYTMQPKQTRMTMLLTATNHFEGNDFVLVLFRQEEPVNPCEGWVRLGTCILRRQGGQWVFTDELNAQSPFGGIFAKARAVELQLGPYEKVVRAGPQSAFPPHFYTIGD